MKQSELQAYIGRPGRLKLEGTVHVERLVLPVTVVDAKVSYEKLKLLCEPVAEGCEGQMWVEEWRVKLGGAQDDVSVAS